jgi:hypothetical protein
MGTPVFHALHRASVGTVLGFWVRAGGRRATLETHPGYRVIEARITRNREQVRSFRLRARR